MYVSPGEHNKLAMPTPIPVGTVLKCEYQFNHFTYTNYNGVNGWIINLDMMTGEYAKVAHKSDWNVIVTTDAAIYDFPMEYAKKRQIIPQNTELHVSYMYEYGDYGMKGYAMVTYDNRNLWIKVEDCAYEVGPVSFRTVEFKEDLIIDDKVVIPKGKTVELRSKYLDMVNYYGQTDEFTNYYFVYDDCGFWENDLGVFYPNNMYVIFLKNYKDLPTNQKMQVKYCRCFIGDDYHYYDKFITLYIEYNNKIYEVKTDYTGLMIEDNEESTYNVYSVIKDLNLTRSPYDNTVIENLSSGDIVYEIYSRKYNLDKNVYYVTTENGNSGFIDLINWGTDENKNIRRIASSVTKDELSNYIKVTKSDITQSINNENSGEHKPSEDENLNIYDIQNENKRAPVLIICILCVCGAAILALIVVITIKLAKELSNKSTELDDKNENDNNNGNSDNTK